MPSTTSSSEFWRGVRRSIPFGIVIVPFSMLFGVVATEAGLTVAETMIFSMTVIAGAAQFTAIGLMQEQAPTIIVLISALAVNMRMAMYSASLVPHFGGAPLWERAGLSYLLVDQAFAMSMARDAEAPERTMRAKLAFFWGCTGTVVPMWWSMTYVGALVGQKIPESMALDFAVPITFLALIAPMLTTRAHQAAAFVAIVVALLTAALPYNLGLLIAGLAGMIAGAEIERRSAP